MTRRVAIVGSGISGLSAAHHLHGHAELTLFEAGDYFGGHTHTVDVTLPTATGLQTHGVDTGFLVYNERTYPGLIALFDELQVATAKSDMSFSVQVPGKPGQRALEWNGANLNTVFAQRSNLFKPRFLNMLRDVMRFNTLATALAERNQDHELAQPLQDFLHTHAFGDTFRDWYLLPMLGCIWSCPTDQMLQFPVATMVRFCHNHGLIQVNNRPQWHTVAGGAKHYVEKIVARIPDKRLNTPVMRIERDAQGATVHTNTGSERFDAVILATHAGQALRMLAAPTPQEQATLGAIRTHANRAVLHTDTSVMPKKKLAWAAWNYERAAQHNTESARVCLHYWLNLLQPLPFTQDVVVSLNPVHEIDPAKVLGTYDYAHPVFDLAATQAQGLMPQLQGQQSTWFAGAWMGYGFHEDGFKAGRAAAQSWLTS
ncbi:NAD(P)/FAD-dependent oxidoreductase [Limnohabitans sp. B9-3]|uniref:NAD(P)/FAD-dependent oxidoreductase n=1 Tax=Limnohabitans sp. B9-3 TaxID=1100707 RepID=UPI000C1E26D3|nr:FAD-dependent oxidoreductase [Limnohabitans sp. B9-3]PIT71624.1 NAD/FAD-binding protein [Limnohabitans sp. B9-3]